ncbi:Gldg family protein [soil metagenome]
MDKTALKKNSIVTLALTIGIIVVVNILTYNYFVRLDLSKNKSYSLSDVSKTLVKGLDDKMVIKVYISDNLPFPYNTVKKNIKDLLEEYRSYSKGNFNYELYNPAGDGDNANSDIQKEAEKYGVQPVQLQISENNKMEVKKAYLGMVFLYNSKQEQIPVIQSVDNLEYDISSNIYKMTRPKKKIGLLAGHGEPAASKLPQISKLLSSQYDIISINAALNTEIQNDLEALIIMAPSSDLKEFEKFQIDQYIMRGGKVAWLVNKIVPNFQQQIALGEPAKTNIDDILDSYGLKINTDLIRDLQCSSVQVQSSIGFPLQVKYPYFPQITNINRDIAAFKNIESVVLTFASSIDEAAGRNKGLNVTTLLKSSDKSGEAKDFFLLNLEQFQNMTKAQADTLFRDKGFTLGAIYTGKFKSFYAGKTPPVDTSVAATPYKGTPLNESQKETKMILIADGDFAIEDNHPPQENILFFTNLIDYMADDIGLAQLRSKESPEPPLKETSDSWVNTAKYINIGLPPLIVILFGIMYLTKRQLRKKKK